MEFDKSVRTLNTKVTDVLRVIEANGVKKLIIVPIANIFAIQGPSVTKLIKAKIPTYCNM